MDPLDSRPSSGATSGATSPAASSYSFSSAFPFDVDPRQKLRHRRALSGITPRELKFIDSVIPLKSRQQWKKFAVKEVESKDDFQSEFVRHVEITLGRSLYNCDELAAYQAAARSIKTKLIVQWNRTQQQHTLSDPKRIYYLSLEFLMGRAMDNALLNTGLKDASRQGLDEFGFRMEDVLEQEPDAGLGNGGLGRLAACFIDSLTTSNYPAWGYGIQYKYGIFQQKIVDGYQVEQPDYWLVYSNPWEITRREIAVDVMFNGYVQRTADDQGIVKKSWVGGDFVRAIAHDMPIPGYKTNNVNNLRLWSSEPHVEFDFSKFNEGDYDQAVREQNNAETISSVLYPNDNFYSGKELRLKQQYFWVAASLSDIVRRFKKTRRPWKEFSDQVAIQLNDTHPTLAIVELMRIFVDREGLDWDSAWAITTETFAYTNHTVLPEALEKWSVDVLGHLLPRHLEIIYDINLFFLQMVDKKFPKDRELLSRVSIIEESSPKQVRMAYLAIIGSHKVNGVAELHSELIRTTIFKDFVAIYGADKFMNVTNGITPRRWLLQANPALASLIAEKLGGSYDYLKDLGLLKGIEKYAHDSEFQTQWYNIKRANKERLAKLVKSQSGLVLNPDALFDVQVKRFHEYKRQQLNIFGVIHRYLELKALSSEEKKKVVPRVSIFGGKSAPGYYMAKVIIKLINSVAAVVNEDEDVKGLLQVAFVEDYNVSKAEIITPASDISEHISTAGTEASGTSNMKFVLNGGLIIGTVDGANIEIAREVGEENMFMFGHLAEAVEDLRFDHRYRGVKLNDKLQKVFETIQSGIFGESHIYNDLISSIRDNGDHYLVSDDFDTYLDAQRRVDEAFVDKDTWVSKSIIVVANMGFFSSDRAIDEYAETIWNVEPLPIANFDE
ncbi:Gph1p [Sugiyamaella lignohabitans]|uniref:Alpha-1,4 glucan phosphorylase n=1 Tax=Sugiyamaella lignohabitans TaxID=796027 RepID=A0A167DDG6_9ASCO|nr:Gph1p [Sugiyamaella lignohabitans]ANB12790.1 Gph1p [Sugiyamaella lignohabitans]